MHTLASFRNISRTSGEFAFPGSDSINASSNDPSAPTDKDLIYNVRGQLSALMFFGVLIDSLYVASIEEGGQPELLKTRLSADEISNNNLKILLK